MKNREGKLQKHIKAETRELMIKIAKDYTKENLDFMSKNSAYNAERVVQMVIDHYISNTTLKTHFYVESKNTFNNENNKLRGNS